MEAGACDYRERLEEHPSSPRTRPLELMLWGSSQKGGKPLLASTALWGQACLIM